MSRQHYWAVSFDGVEQGLVINRIARANKFHIQRYQSRTHGSQFIE
jgi:hypothetical protein